MRCNLFLLRPQTSDRELSETNSRRAHVARHATAVRAGSFLAVGIFVLLCGSYGGAVAQPSPPEPEDNVQTQATSPADADASSGLKSDDAADNGDAPAETVQGAKSEPDQGAGAKGDAEAAKDGDTKDGKPESQNADADSAVQTPAEPPADAADKPADSDAATADAQENDKPETADNNEASTGEPAATGAALTAKKLEPVEESKTLKIATWSGAFGKAQKAVVIDRFSAENSVDVAVINRDDKDPLDLAQSAGSGGVDAAELSQLEVIDGCKSGKLAKLPGEELGASDFVKGSVLPCGIGSFAWSHVFAANRDAFQKSKPETLEDVFDAKKFPGKRALIKSPKFLLEAALIADGAKPEEVYELLTTEEGRTRAFDKLDTIKPDIIWFDSSAATMDAFNSGKVVFAQTFSGRAFFDAARGHAVDIIWDGQIYAMTYWGIPAGAKRTKIAQDFVKFAVEPQQLAGVAQRFPYGPTRTAALALSKRHITAGIDLGPYLPTAPGNMKTALQLDEVWWRDNGKAIEAAFADWLAK